MPPIRDAQLICKSLNNPPQINETSMKNRSKSVLGAMLADDDISLEPPWPKMTSRIDFLSILGTFWGTQNASKTDPKMKLFADVSRNLVFSKWS